MGTASPVCEDLEMDTEKLRQELLVLNRYEEAGKRYYEMYGKEMDYTHYYYMIRHGGAEDPLTILGSETADEERKAFREQFIAAYKGMLPAQVFISEGKNVEMEQLFRYVHMNRHMHDFLELVCVLNGTCVHSFGNHTSRHIKGDFTIIPPGLDHELFPSPDCLCITVKIRRETFFQVFAQTIQENSLLSSYFAQVLSLPHLCYALTMHCADDPFFHRVVLEAYEQQLNGKAHCDAIIQALWQALFAYLLQNYSETAQCLISESNGSSKIADILNYIFENFQTITLKETARHFYFSVPYLSTTIRNATGKPFSRLLQDYKLQQAANMLKDTGMKVEQICEAVGYQDASQFARAFKKVYALTPKEYRRMYSEQKERTQD